MAADHFQPWVPQQGQASFVWNVLGAIGERTTGDIGPGVTTPTFRWHPAMVAQASRRWPRCTRPALARPRLGRGAQRARRRRSTGQRRPSASTACSRRSRSSRSCSRLARRQGRQARRPVLQARVDAALDDARASPPRSSSPRPVRSRRSGRAAWPTGSSRRARRLEKIGGLFASSTRARARRAGTRRRCPRCCSCTCRGPDRRGGDAQRARRVAQRGHEVPQERHPLAVRVRADGASWCARRTSRAAWSSRADPDAHRAEIQRYLDLGFDRIYLHNVGRNQREWIEVFGRDVLPGLVR